MCDLNGLEAVTGRGRAQPEFLTLYFHCEDDDVEQPSVVVRNDAGAIVLGVETYRTRFSETKIIRDGASGKVLLTAHARGLRRRSWKLRDHKERDVLTVDTARLLWRRKKHGKGVAKYVLKAWEPHFPRPCIRAEPEHGRLVLRTAGRQKVRGQPGEAMAEVLFATNLEPGAQPVKRLLQGREWEEGCHAALSPRAEAPLVCLLLAIYTDLLLRNQGRDCGSSRAGSSHGGSPPGSSPRAAQQEEQQPAAAHFHEE